MLFQCTRHTRSLTQFMHDFDTSQSLWRYTYCVMPCIIMRCKTTRVCHCRMKIVRCRWYIIAKVFDYNFFPESSLNQGVWQQAAQVLLASTVKLVLHSSLTWKLSPLLLGRNSFTTHLCFYGMPHDFMSLYRPVFTHSIPRCGPSISVKFSLITFCSFISIWSMTIYTPNHESHVIFINTSY